jgi:hypothetical protein
MKRFLRDLFRMPGVNGERRLVKNYFTGKLIWTNGKEPDLVKTKGEDFKKEKNNYVDNSQEETKANRNSFKHISHTIGYESIKNGRFIVHFSDIQPYFIKSYKYLGVDGDNNHVSRILIYLPASPVLALEEKLIGLIDEKLEPVSIDILDPIGTVLRVIHLSDVTVQEVSLFDDLDYSKDDIQMAEVIFSHKERKIINPYNKPIL